jgi:penicillin-binding protein 1A
MPRSRRLLGWLLAILIVFFVLGFIVAAVIYRNISSKLPDVQSLRQVELQEPMYVYASDGRLMAVYGETRRYPIRISEVPEQLKQAFLATEDARFYEHGGVDYKGIARAVWLLATTDDKRVPGGSTITQQVARQFFLSSEYSYTRKFAEILLARKIESELSKDEIFELYLNKSFFGNRAYGIGAAAEFYYGKKLNQLTLDEMASLAGIPKFPSSGNPISNPKRARERRDYYVLQRMASLGFITQAEADDAKAIPMHASPHEPPIQVYAPYVAEMVRQEMIARYGGDVLNKGYHVTTTINPALQDAAVTAVRDGLLLYDHRHGWNGVEQHFDVSAQDDATALASHLAGIPTQSGLRPAIVSSTHPDGSISAVLKDRSIVELPVSATRWTSKTPAALLKRGDLVRIRASPKPGEWTIDQLPRGQAALVSLDANNGALRAMVGGFSYAGNKFNRATQARRQPGSSFKPFIYAAAFEKGYNPASIVLDAPVTFRDRRGKTWQPQNDGGGFRGPMLLREALVQSRNLVSVRLLDSIGVDFARRYISQFGFDEAELPPNLSMSLGSASLTPMSVARGYAVFANGGSLVDPWVIDEIKDRNGNVVFKENPGTACRSCALQGGKIATAPQVVDGFNFGAATPAPAQQGNQPFVEPPATQPSPATAETKIAPRAIDERTAFQLVSMMRDVVQRGTGVAAKTLGREDVGGKTGSTNDHRDAWFSGFGGPYATTVWVGRDNFQSLGYHEYGGRAALPIWIEYMRVALQDTPIARNDPPDGMTQTTFNGATEWIKNEDLDRLQDYDHGLHEQDTDAAEFDIF